MLNTVIRRLVLLTFTIVVFTAYPHKGHAIRFACKDDICKQARIDYTDHKLRTVCALPARIDGQLRALAVLEARRSALQERALRCSGNRCIVIAQAILRMNRRIARIERRLENFVNRVLVECELSARLEGKNKCKQSETQSYCGNLASLRSGSIRNRATAAKNLIEDRCKDLRVEQGDQLASCNVCTAAYQLEDRIRTRCGAFPTATPSSTPSSTPTPAPTSTLTAVPTTTSL